jgi:hypothetical protein
MKMTAFDDRAPEMFSLQPSRYSHTACLPPGRLSAVGAAVACAESDSSSTCRRWHGETERRLPMSYHIYGCT